MTEVDVRHLHEDIIKLQQDVSVIKHILSEEGELTTWAKKALAKARAEPESKYADLNDL